jgi:hypothetical protein
MTKSSKEDEGLRDDGERGARCCGDVDLASSRSVAAVSSRCHDRLLRLRFEHRRTE